MKNRKKDKQGEQKSNSWYFTTAWRCHLLPDLNQIKSMGSQIPRYSHACQICKASEYSIFDGFPRPTVRKTHFPLNKLIIYGLYDIAMCYRGGLHWHCVSSSAHKYHSATNPTDGRERVLERAATKTRCWPSRRTRLQMGWEPQATFLRPHLSTQWHHQGCSSWL